MRCFVIMPFDGPFDDVYQTIRTAVTGVKHSEAIDCIRLDEIRPAGRITDRLLTCLRESSFCVADLTGCKPNVMWETGYAMALGKPIIIVTQDISSLPFDVKDMQALSYDRNQLTKSLGTPLRDIVFDTLVAHPKSVAQDSLQEDQARLVVGLGVQLAELKEMVGQIVSTWDSNPRAKAKTPLLPRLWHLEGAWFNVDSESNIYVDVIRNVVVAPYCYGGDDQLTAYYYDWQEMGEYLFARFKWINTKISGFTFLKLRGSQLRGAWWYDEDVRERPNRPPMGSGKPVIWERSTNSVPTWAHEFFERVGRGLVDDYPITR